MGKARAERAALVRDKSALEMIVKQQLNPPLGEGVENAGTGPTCVLDR